MQHASPRLVSPSSCPAVGGWASSCTCSLGASLSWYQSMAVHGTSVGDPKSLVLPSLISSLVVLIFSMDRSDRSTTFLNSWFSRDFSVYLWSRSQFLDYLIVWKWDCGYGRGFTFNPLITYLLCLLYLPSLQRSIRVVPPNSQSRWPLHFPKGWWSSLETPIPPWRRRWLGEKGNLIYCFEKIWRRYLVEHVFPWFRATMSNNC